MLLALGSAPPKPRDARAAVLPAVHEALNIRFHGPPGAATATGIERKGVCARDGGNVSELRDAVEALQGFIRQASAAGDGLLASQALGLEAQCLRAGGDPDLAVEALRQAAEQVSDPRTPEELSQAAWAWTAYGDELADIYGWFREAFAAHRNALDLRERYLQVGTRAGDRIDPYVQLGNSYLNFGDLLWRSGYREEAMDHYERCRHYWEAAIREGHQEHLRALIDLRYGATLIDLGDARAAAPHIENGWALVRKYSPNNDKDWYWGPYARFVLARLFEVQGRAAEAEALRRELVEAWFAHSWKPELRAVPAPMREDVGLDILLWAADARLEQGAFDEARRLLEEALRVAHQSGRLSRQVRALQLLGLLAERTGRDADALQRYLDGLALLEASRQHALVGAPAEALTVASRPLYEAVVDLLLRKPELQRRAPRTSFEYAELSRARSLMEIFAQREVFHFPPELQDARTALAKTQRALAAKRLVMARMASTESARERNRLGAEVTELLHREAQQLQRFYARLPLVRELEQPRIATAREAAALLRGKRAALLAYYRAGNDWWLWVFTGPDGRLLATRQLTRTAEENHLLATRVRRVRELTEALVAGSQGAA
ncbi:MAG: hypothetical protein ACREQB_09640, partial [Candidatus Binataceae bacterium]